MAPSTGDKNIDIQHNPPDPNIPVEHQMGKATKPEPTKDAYADSPSSGITELNPHDRDSVQPPGNRGTYAPEAPRASER